MFCSPRIFCLYPFLSFTPFSTSFPLTSWTFSYQLVLFKQTHLLLLFHSLQDIKKGSLLPTFSTCRFSYLFLKFAAEFCALMTKYNDILQTSSRDWYQRLHTFIQTFSSFIFCVNEKKLINSHSKKEIVSFEPTWGL